MTIPSAHSFETAEDRTLHCTLSLYVRPEKLWDTGREKFFATKPAIGGMFQPGRIARMQLKEPVSRALRDAVEPLFNDIADRETQGEANDFLLAIDPGWHEADAPAAARRHTDLTFHPPKEVSWRTEGREFVAAPKDLDRKRHARMRRFWFVHNNGALSWHVSITLRYDHDPASYLFLSMLQKLAAPKEFALSPELLEKFAGSTDERGVSVFEKREFGIAPLDGLLVDTGDKTPSQFWPLLKRLFDDDFTNVANRLAVAHGVDLALPLNLDPLELTNLVEVPGLQMPRCRTMMFFHDKRFFERLAPMSDKTGKAIPRRMLVQDTCYDAYATRISDAIDAADRKGSRRILLGERGKDAFWPWVRARPEHSQLSDGDVERIRNGEPLESGQTLHIPSFDRQRTDCLDYLFLSGFNQNIIDFMNQDPSEILDGTDPIYPANDGQSEEGFFVRFANHRSMITYAKRSRSLEVGNDYIGTCPYAFLIHTLSLHNEFLARDFESSALGELAKIDSELNSKVKSDGYRSLARRINDLKVSRYRNFEQYRHINVFRYDTEKDVFAELEQLRGVRRKDTALELALASLEDHADDLESYRSAERDRSLGAIGFVLGGLGIAEAISKLSEFIHKHNPAGPWGSAADMLSWLSVGLTFAAVVCASVFAIQRRDAIRQLFERGTERAQR